MGAISVKYSANIPASAIDSVSIVSDPSMVTSFVANAVVVSGFSYGLSVDESSITALTSSLEAKWSEAVESAEAESSSVTTTESTSSTNTTVENTSSTSTTVESTSSTSTSSTSAIPQGSTNTTDESEEQMGQNNTPKWAPAMSLASEKKCIFAVLAIFIQGMMA